MEKLKDNQGVVLREIKVRDIKSLLNEPSIWENSFLVASSHRLFAHSKNKFADADDVILLIAYLDGNIAGYMGAFIDQINISGNKNKVAWLSTWWVDPSTKGRGVGKAILEKMYEVHNGKIGISQFTESAKRVYDKSGYFNHLNKLEGCKVDIRFNLQNLLPLYNPKFKRFVGLLSLTDYTFNFFVNLKLKLFYKYSLKRIQNCKVDYLNNVDKLTQKFIDSCEPNSFCRRDADFFEFLKAYHWIQEAPLIDINSKREKYFFSSYTQKFNIYLLKIEDNSTGLIGFIVMSRKDKELKILQTYYKEGSEELVSRLILMHGIKLNISTIITYDSGLTSALKKKTFARVRFKKKERESIISKAFGEMNFEGMGFQYGDGDCSFA